MSTQTEFTMYELAEAGAHFGHKTMRWNPKMNEYIFGIKDKIHIINLQKTVPLLRNALEIVKQIAKNNGRILFVGTKKQASDIVAENAKRCGQYFVNHRWLGGMLTNWNTVSKSIDSFKKLDEKIKIELNQEESNLTKKEILELTRKYEKANLSLGGIREMGGKPDILFIIDSNKESIAIQEATKLNIPIIAILDTNSNPDNITYPIPGNDDATRAIKLYCRLFSDAVLAGIEESLMKSGMAKKENLGIVNQNNFDSLTEQMKSSDKINNSGI